MKAQLSHKNIVLAGLEDVRTLRHRNEYVVKSVYAFFQRFTGTPYEIFCGWMSREDSVDDWRNWQRREHLPGAANIGRKVSCNWSLTYFFKKGGAWIAPEMIPTRIWYHICRRSPSNIRPQLQRERKFPSRRAYVRLRTWERNSFHITRAIETIGCASVASRQRTARFTCPMWKVTKSNLPSGQVVFMAVMAAAELLIQTP